MGCKLLGLPSIFSTFFFKLTQDHKTMTITNTELFSCTPETDIMFYVNYTLIKKKLKNKKKIELYN